MKFSKLIQEWFSPASPSPEQEQAIITHLQPELNTVQLPGPFDFSMGLGGYSKDTFHKKTDMGVLIHKMKVHHSTAAADRLVSFLIRYLEENRLPSNPDLVITVPDSLTNRPFSPTEYLCDCLVNHFDWTARHDIITRIRQEKPQKDRSFEERIDDTRPRYGLRYPNDIRDKHVLLFDDIYATGRSLIEAADLIREQSPASVMALTLVRLE